MRKRVRRADFSVWLAMAAIAAPVRGSALAQEAPLVMGPPATRPSLILGPPAPAKVVARASDDGATTQATFDRVTAAQTGAPAVEQPNVDGGLVEFLAARFAPHEPMYFLWGPDQPNIKFQISLKYQILSPQGSIAQAAPWLANFHLGYSQTSFWNFEGDSNPFFDNSYRPELMYLWEPERRDWLPGLVARFDLQAGLQHESNGQDGPESRSLNIAYVRPVFTFGDDGRGSNRGQWFLAVAPRLWAYTFSKEDNPDIAQYRGYGDLKVIVGQRGGLQFAMLGRAGSDFDKGSFQLDVSYPLRELSARNLDLYLHGQFFTGYGESLLEYDESDTTFRIGLSLVR